MIQHILVGLALALGQTDSPRTQSQNPINGDAKTVDGKESETDSSKSQGPDRYLLMKSLDGTSFGACLEAHRLQIGGWTDMSFAASSAAHSQLPMGFNYRANEFLLQQNWLRIERTVNADAACPTFGFRSDTILPGSDYRFTVARGLFDSQLTDNDGQPATYGIDPIQFYAEAYFPNICKGLDVKFGRIFCQYGIESNAAVDNALGSRCYTFIYDPFTHTGLMGTLKLDDTWSVQAGIMLGNDVFIDPACEPYGMGSVKWAPKDGKSSILFSVILGSGRFNQAENFHNPEVFDVVFAHKFNDKLTYNFEGLYGFTTNVPAIGDAHWFGVLNYLTRQICPKWSATGRLEFFDDIQGQRTGFEGLYTAITAGISYKPKNSIIIRPEVRYDYNGETRPFEGRHGLFTAALDVIVRW